MLPRIIAALLILAVLAGIGVILYVRKKLDSLDAGVPLSKYLAMGRDYRFLVGFPPHEPTEWIAVQDAVEGFVTR